MIPHIPADQLTAWTLNNLCHPTDELSTRWDAICKMRDLLLGACDWTQLPDVPLTAEQVVAWQAYRQTLRDIPQECETPEDVVFPNQP